MKPWHALIALVLLTFDAAGATLIAHAGVATRDSTLVRIDKVTGEAVPIMTFQPNLGPVFATDVAGSRLFVGSFENRAYGMAVINLNTRTVSRSNLPPSQPYQFYDDVEDQLIAARWDAGVLTVTAYDVETGAVQSGGTFASVSPVHARAFDPVSRMLYFRDLYFRLHAMNVDTGVVTMTPVTTNSLTSLTVLNGRLLALQLSDTHLAQSLWTVVEVDPATGNIVPLVSLGHAMQFHLLPTPDPETNELLVNEQLDTTGGYALGIIDLETRQWRRIPYATAGTFDYTFVAASWPAPIPTLTFYAMVAACMLLAFFAMRRVGAV